MEVDHMCSAVKDDKNQPLQDDIPPLSKSFAGNHIVNNRN